MSFFDFMAGALKSFTQVIVDTPDGRIEVTTDSPNFGGDGDDDFDDDDDYW